VKKSLFSNIIKIADEERLSIKSYPMRDMILNPYLQKRGDYSDGLPLHSQSNSGKGTEQLLQEVEEREKYIKQMTEKTDSLEKDGYEKGFAQGERAGMELGEKRFDSVVKSFNEVLEGVRRLKKEVYQNSEQEMLELILAIARRVIQKEVSTDRKITLKIIQSALKYVTDQEEIRVRLNPSDLEFASEYKGEMMKEMKKAVFESDEDVSRGHTVIESNHGIVDCGIEKHLQEVEKVLRSQAGVGNILGEEEQQRESRENHDS